MCKKTEKRGDGSQDEGNNMQDKSIREPFDDNFRNLDVGFISYKFVDIFYRGSAKTKMVGTEVSHQACSQL